MTRRQRPLTFLQRQVILTLGDRPLACAGMEFYPLTAEQAYGVVQRLCRRGLVDYAGWDSYERRIYKLTSKGYEMLAELAGEEGEDG